MREDNLLCLREKKPFVPYTTNSRHEFPIVSNLTRGLVPTGLNQIWVADITYVRLAEQFVYLAVVLDAPGAPPIGANISGPWIGTCVFFAEALADDGTEPPSGFAGKRRSARA